MDKFNVIVIGAGPAGLKTAMRLKRLDFNQRILVIDKGTYPSFAACGMPFYLEGLVKDFNDLQKTSFGSLRDKNYFKNYANIDLLLNYLVTEIDPKSKTVLALNNASNEKFKFQYNKLVISTGSQAIVPPIEGLSIEDKNLFTLKSPSDVIKIKSYLEENEVNSVCILGSGLIGCEVASSLFNSNIDVSLFEIFDWPLATLIDKEIGLYLKKQMFNSGIEIYTGEKIVKFVSENKKTIKAISEKREVNADMFLICSGVRPNTEIAKKAGLEISARGSIVTNEFLQTSNPDIYAVGDCIEIKNLLTNKTFYAPMATYANRLGRLVANNIIKNNSQAFDGAIGTAIVKILDFNIARTGLSEKEAKDLNINFETVYYSGFDKPHYMTESNKINIKLIFDKNTDNLIGAQCIGKKASVDKTIDVAATIIQNKIPHNKVLNLDLSYSPPFSNSVDILVQGFQIYENKKNNMYKGISFEEVKEMFEKDNNMENVVLLDVRSEDEFKRVPSPFKNAINIPIDYLYNSDLEYIKNKKIIIFCGTGSRSYQASVMLKNKGFKEIYNLEAGVSGFY
ncbi:NADPH-dependent 2,4-dienoyl-CoA reductase, sulfur reductase [Thermodesulfobium acidiphilum]|uniref:NADPH-dependent 2,4-dienoyl-CoA reductase, sulfur reductase n=1 Tax=Thermodesulfobium acidiphilum TaxID=1794699 RepID=A0A2R4W037_THEAF|nr:FAD-dependent oxidoreductase [Thermodesulfobium acidiphilum]AWB10086.1 NADPH-dependent 2,4-dienoyl-CoA reductase, sulfur reductase [Thermodesulfobium acidiphilum]